MYYFCELARHVKSGVDAYTTKLCVLVELCMLFCLAPVDDYIAQFERKITFWTEFKTTLTEEEAKRLGLKDPEE